MPWLPLKEIVNLIYSVELAAQLLAHNAKCLAVNSSAVTVKEKKGVLVACMVVMGGSSPRGVI